LQASEELSTIKPYYIASVFFLCPFPLIKFYFISELSFLNGEMAFFGAEDEKDAPPPSRDLSGLSLRSFLLKVILSPFVLLLRILRYLLWLLWKPTVTQQSVEDGANEKEPKLSYYQRSMKQIGKLLQRGGHLCCVFYELILCCESCEDVGQRIRTSMRTRKDSDQIHPSERYNRKVDEIQSMTMKRSAANEGLDQKIQQSAVKMKPQPLARRSSKPPINSSLSNDGHEQRLLETENSRSLRSSLGERNSSTLSLNHPQSGKISSYSKPDFERVWQSLAFDGSFACELEQEPNIQLFRDHLEKQKFSIIFMSTSREEEGNPASSLSVKIGICNIKQHDADSSFLAMFYFNKSLQLAVTVKCDDEMNLARYVERFELANVLTVRDVID
jgi:hypothetical protein